MKGMKTPPTDHEARRNALVGAIAKAGMRVAGCGGDDTATRFGYHLHLSSADGQWLAHTHGGARAPVASAPFGREADFAAELSLALADHADQARARLVGSAGTADRSRPAP
jgi:hypothetical protein